MAKEEETEEEAPVSGEEGAEELAPDEALAVLEDAEVLIRTGSEKIDWLFEMGVVDEELRKQADDLWNTILAKIESMEQES